MKPQVKIIVGLGNPGHTYANTRHNVGFAVIEILGTRKGVRVDKRLVSQTDRRPAAVYGDYEHGAETVRLLMPLTMMNESGDAVRDLDVAPTDLLVVCDDVNLPLGMLRLRPQGGAGGHHGLASCLDALGTEDVARLRIGVGISPLPEDLTDFVLSPFGREERPRITPLLEQASKACEVWVQEGIEVAMNRYNMPPSTS